MDRRPGRVTGLRRARLAAPIGALVGALIAPAGVVAADPPARSGPEPAFPRAADEARGPADPDGEQKVIIRYRERPGAADSAAIRAVDGEVRFRYSIVDAIAATVPSQAIPGLRRNPNVASIEADGRLTAFDHGANTGDLEYENAWGVEHLGTRLVHGAGITGAGIKVAVIDTGLDYVHYDPTASPPIYNEFNAAWAGYHSPYVGGWDFVNGDADPMDDNGHGTHVSGILAAELNGYLVAGMAPGVDLYALKVLGATGEGDYSGLIAALDWVVANDIDVVNMSLGGHEVSQALADAIAAAYDAGVVLVGASGNVNPLNIIELIYGCPVAYPAAYPQVLSTTFTNGADELTGYSCTGPEVDFGAPGDQIYSTVPIGPAGSCMFCTPTGYSAQSGTSMASPHLTGLVALVLDHGIADADADGQLTPEIKAHLCANTNPGGRIAQTDPRYPSWYGCGVVDADRALLVDPPDTGGGPTNAAPVATDDAATTAEDTPIEVAVLGNDSDPDPGDSLAVTGVSSGAHGTTTHDGTTVIYTPAADWHGTDTFTYSIGDGHGGVGTAAVAVTVSPVNDAPTAAADSASTGYGTPVTISVLGNDTDVDGDGLAVASVTQPLHGTTTTNGMTVTYTPAAGWSGPDSFGYTVADGHGGSADGAVSVTVASPAPSTVMHVGDLDQAASRQKRSWTAQVTVLVLDTNGLPVGSVTVSGSWSGGAKGSGSCITGASGTCTIAKSGIGLAKASATFTVSSLARTGWTYDASANTDPDPAGSGQASNGQAITVPRPA